jgi:hypothetical protein
MTSPAILPSRNTEWGYWGTISRVERNSSVEVAEAWALASGLIAVATGAAPDGVRDFLDSRDGRHFADTVADELARGISLVEAIEAAVALWMGWRIDRRTSRESGIPAGLPYLTGLVCFYEILAETGPENA